MAEVERQAARGDGWVKLVGDWIDREVGDLAPLWPAGRGGRRHRPGARAGVPGDRARLRRAGRGRAGGGRDRRHRARHRPRRGDHRGDGGPSGRAGADDDPARELRALSPPAAEEKFPTYAAHMRSLYARPARPCSRRAHEAGVPIYAGTDAGGYLPHGLVGQEMAALAGFSSAEYALGAGSWRARALARPPRHPGRGGARRPGRLRRRPAPRPRRAPPPPPRRPARARRWLSRAAAPSPVTPGCGVPSPWCWPSSPRWARCCPRRRRPPPTRRPSSRPVLSVAGTPEPDGQPVELDVTLMTTDPGGAATGHRAGPRLRRHQGRLARRSAGPWPAAGYTVLTYTARGFGASGGLIHLDDPAYEGGDAVRLVDRRRPGLRCQAHRRRPGRRLRRCLLRRRGSPWWPPASTRRVDAIVPAFTWNSLTHGAGPAAARSPDPRPRWPTSRPDDAGVFKQRWAALFFRSGATAGASRRVPATAPAAQARQLCGRFAPDALPGLPGRPPEPGRPDAGLLALLDRIAPARLLLPGARADPAGAGGGRHAVRARPGRRDGPRPAGRRPPPRWSGSTGGHDGVGRRAGPAGPSWQAWFDRYLRGDGTPAPPGLSAVVPQTALVGRADDDAPAHRCRRPATPAVAPRWPTEARRSTAAPQPVARPRGRHALGAHQPARHRARAGRASTGLAGYGLAVLPGPGRHLHHRPAGRPAAAARQRPGRRSRSPAPPPRPRSSPPSGTSART